MDGIYEIVGYILKITLLGFVTFVVINILRNMKKRTLRDEISRVEAKIAAYRINLKSKVKKKAKRFRASYPQSINTGDPIDNSISQLSELSFETNSDFQNYIELCRKVNYYIEMANVEKQKKDPNIPFAAPLMESTADFMGTDFKNEIGIARTINDMVTVSKVLNKLLSKYNHYDPKAKVQVIEPIIFQSLFELQKVFKGEAATAELDAQTAELNPTAQAHKIVA